MGRSWPNFNLFRVKLDYRNSAEIIANTPEAYEKLILDCLNGDGTSTAEVSILENC